MQMIGSESGAVVAANANVRRVGRTTARHRPGRGEAARRRAAPTRSGPDLYRDTLNHLNNFFRPDPSCRDAESGRSALLRFAWCYLVRRGGLDAGAEDELAFQFELQAGLRPALTRGWRENTAHPALVFLRDMRALAPYGFGLAWLLFDRLDRAVDGRRLLADLEALDRSWTLTMDPGEGYLSRMLIRTASLSAAWWSKVHDPGGDWSGAVRLGALGALVGAATGWSGNLLTGRPDPRPEAVWSASIAASLAASTPELPAVRSWLRSLPEAGSGAEGR